MYILELLKKNSENYEIIAEPGESFEKKDEILKRMKGYDKLADLHLFSVL